jgi:hypothetical protein
MFARRITARIFYMTFLAISAVFNSDLCIKNIMNKDNTLALRKDKQLIFGGACKN